MTQAGADNGLIILHASSVAVAGKAMLVTGASGTGKSGLCLTLMAFGARLVADDGVTLRRVEDRVTVAPVPAIAGKIEARGIGILNADAVFPADLSLVVDLNHTEHSRLPPHRQVSYFDRPFRLLHKVESAHFAPAIMQYLKTDQGV